MKHLAAYLLLGLGGNSSPSAEDIKTVLSAVGIEADEERLTKLISELEGKDISEVRHVLSRASLQKEKNKLRTVAAQ
ncbi:60S acidic ribosomal protein P2 [Claviceps sorghi]|nr:60S acidic ribosomal protein P2 [Claviceps sorghi]